MVNRFTTLTEREDCETHALRKEEFLDEWL